MFVIIFTSFVFKNLETSIQVVVAEWIRHVASMQGSEGSSPTTVKQFFTSFILRFFLIHGTSCRLDPQRGIRAFAGYGHL